MKSKEVFYELAEYVKDHPESPRKAVDEFLANRWGDNNGSPEFLINVVCDYFGISRGALFSDRRDDGVIIPRRHLYMLMKDWLYMRDPEIASYIGLRDRTTVIYNINRGREAFLQPQDKVFVREHEEIESFLKCE